MDLGLTNKIALVTGSTGGVGLAIAQSLAAEGSHVYVNGRTQPRAAAAVAATRLRTATASVKGIVADLSSAAGLKRLPPVCRRPMCS